MAETCRIDIWWKGPGRAAPIFRLDGEKISLAKLATLFNLRECAVESRIAKGLHPEHWFLRPEQLGNLRKRGAIRSA